MTIIFGTIRYGISMDRGFEKLSELVTYLDCNIHIKKIVF